MCSVVYFNVDDLRSLVTFIIQSYLVYERRDSNCSSNYMYHCTASSTNYIREMKLENP